jgi:ribonuclease HII
MAHKLVLGIDEAGYGPNMGPFVVVATAWRVPKELAVEELTELLRPEIQPLPIGLRTSAPHVPLGDSKRIYSGKSAWEGLCHGAQFLLEFMEFSQRNVPLLDVTDNQVSKELEVGCLYDSQDIGTKLYPQDWVRVKQVLWYQNLQLWGAENHGASERLTNHSQQANEAARAKLRSLEIEPLSSRGRLIDEREWNRLVEHFQNKSSVLSELTLGLARDLAHDLAIDNEAIEIYCDKHGGRNRYHGLLMNAFQDQWFDTHVESSKLSRYSTNWENHPLIIQFRVEGDSLVPSAAASILAKWTREMAMKVLNGFWGEQAVKHGKPTPKPTAGYYVDAMRFSEDIKEMVAENGPPKSEWWRAK